MRLFNQTEMKTMTLEDCFQTEIRYGLLGLHFYELVDRWAGHLDAYAMFKDVCHSSMIPENYYPMCRPDRYLAYNESLRRVFLRNEKSTNGEEKYIDIYHFIPYRVWRRWFDGEKWSVWKKMNFFKL